MRENNRLLNEAIETVARIKLKNLKKKILNLAIYAKRSALYWNYQSIR